MTQTQEVEKEGRFLEMMDVPALERVEVSTLEMRAEKPVAIESNADGRCNCGATEECSRVQLHSAPAVSLASRLSNPSCLAP